MSPGIRLLVWRPVWVKGGAAPFPDGVGVGGAQNHSRTRTHLWSGLEGGTYQTQAPTQAPTLGDAYT